MNDAKWFSKQIDANTESLAWGLEQIPSDRLYAAPPTKLGEWSAARHIFHLLYYEREVALPSLKHWFDEPYPTFEGYDENAAWGQGKEVKGTFTELREVRAEQLSLLARAKNGVWDQAHGTSWGHQTFCWVVSKTYQHGVQHLSDILRIVMLWDHYAQRESNAKREGAEQ